MHTAYKVIVWCRGSALGLNQRSYSMLGTVNTWMCDHLWAGKPSRYVASHLGQLSLPSIWGRLIKYQPLWLGLGGARSPVSGGRLHSVNPYGRLCALKL